MNIGFWSCIILVIPFVIIGVLFAIFKEKATKFVSGFNSFSKEEQAMYDKAQISRDIRNQCFIWTVIMLAGATLSCFLTPYMAIPTYIIWLVLFFREVHFDNHKAFKKYLLKYIIVCRRCLFMKKGINKSILFYVVSALFLIASAIGLTTGNENTMAIIWLSLGSAFLCLGSTYKKKENNKTNTDDK